MNAEELMKPRFLIIADYPNNDLGKVGEILNRDWCKYINDDEEDLRRAYTVGKHGGVNQTYYDFDEWFENFKKK